MNTILRGNVRKTALAGLLALVLLAGTFPYGSAAQAAGPAGSVQIFYGFVFPTQNDAVPKRIRAVSEQGVVCGSGEVSQLDAGHLGYYALAVLSGSEKEGCPGAGEPIRLVAVYGMIDEGIVVDQAVFEPGAITSFHLRIWSADQRFVLP
ncbi:MAG: hypothetical protein WC273_06845 [Dehalococcoidia bacterium]